MKDLKNFFITLKSWWDNPRRRGVVQIFFWIIFFFFFSILFRTGKSNDEKVKENSINTNNNGVISYEYEYKYQDDINNIVINGTYYDEKEKLVINNTNFYYLDGNYYNELTHEMVKVDYALNEWSYKSVKNITDHNSYSNVTKYKSGDSKYVYNISKEIYNNYYKSTYMNDIVITITKNSKDIIYEAVINYGFGVANIKYTSINEIDYLDINME